MSAGGEPESELTSLITKKDSRWANARFYVVVLTTFLVKGVIENLPSLAASYYAKDTLKLHPGVATALGSLMIMPWTFKPLYGFMSDKFPIFGYRRKSYAFISGLIVALSFFLLGTVSNSTWSFVVLRLVGTLAMAVATVVMEALTVEHSQGLSQSDAATYQSMIWGANAASGTVAAYFGGVLLKWVSYKTVFFITGFFPAVMAFVCLLSPEKQFSEQYAMDFSTYMGILFDALKQPTIWKPTLVIFLIFATPNTGSSGFYFFTNKLKLSSTLLATVTVFASIASVAGIAFYQAFLKHRSTRSVIIWTTVVGTLLGSTSCILFLRWNIAMGIPDTVFLLTDTPVVSAVGQVSQMPIMTLAARLCPPGVEGTMFSLLTSIMNFGNFVSGELGAAMTPLFGVTAHHFKWLWLFCLICNLSSLLPLVLIRWIPSYDGVVSWDTSPRAAGVAGDSESPGNELGYKEVL